MADRSQIPLTGRDGKLGWVNLDEQPADQQEALIRLENGQAVRVPADLLVRHADGSFYLPMNTQQFHRAQQSPVGADHEPLLVIPVIAEEVAISKREVTSGLVKINKRVHKRDEVIDIPLRQQSVKVEHVPVNRLVDTPPEVRYEGDTIVIPVLEEILVVEKRLRLKEEVRVTQVQKEVRKPQKVTLTEESVEVRRDAGGKRPDKDEEI